MHPSASLHVRCRTRALVALGLALLLPLVAYPQSSNGNGAANGNANGAANNKGNGKSDADNDWDGLMAAAIGNGKQSSNTDQAASALAFANQARDYAAKYPQSSNAAEARKLEAIYLVSAVAAGDTTSVARMESTVKAFRQDTTVAASLRAAVAGTHDFFAAGKNAGTYAQLVAEHDAIARGLMQEFPDQPQGFLSLLDQAVHRDPATARNMAQEVLAAKQAPLEAITAAQALTTRIDLVGTPVASVLNGLSTGADGSDNWPKKKAGIVYFWATQRPDSIELGQMLATKNLSNIYVVGVGLDPDDTAAMAMAKSAGLPGKIIIAPGGVSGRVAIRLGVDTAPLVYFVNEDGKFSDTFGLQNLTTKLAALGL